MNIPMIPREVLFGNPDKVIPSISPDGNYISYVAPYNGVLNIWLKKIDEDEAKPITEDKDRGIWEYFWSRDNKYILYLQDQGGNENWRLHSIELATGEIRDLTPYQNVQTRVIEVSKEYPEEILIAMNHSHPELHDIYKLTLASGKLEIVSRNQGNAIGWIADPEMKIRGSVMALADGSYELAVRDTGDDATDEWRTFIIWGTEDNINSEPLSFTKDGKAMYLIDSRNANAGRLVKAGLYDSSYEVIAEDDRYDVESVIINPASRDIQAVAFNRERREWKVIDKELDDDFKKMMSLCEGDMFLQNRDNADTNWLIGFEQDKGPIRYFLYNRRTKTGRHLFDNRPDLNEYELADMEPVSFTARDGLEVHGYITFPKGVEPKNLPMVLNVHGGPWYRDKWGYNSEAQWLANRGYICFQVNFRGSTGYGKKFLNAGNKEWGNKMHFDLIDAIDWAVDHGYADPKKIAVYGGSYGGYAALVGATFTPDLFCCAVDAMGPSSLITLIESIPPYWKTMLATFHTRIGNPETEEDFLKSRSPLYKVDNIKIPLLIGQGANDPRVTIKEAKQITNAMDKNGIKYEYVEFSDEGHGFAKPDNRMKFYGIAERFLHQYLGGRYEE